MTGLAVTVAVLGILVGVFVDEYVRQLLRERRERRAVKPRRAPHDYQLADRLRWYTLR